MQSSVMCADTGNKNYYLAFNILSESVIYKTINLIELLQMYIYISKVK